MAEIPPELLPHVINGLFRHSRRLRCDGLPAEADRLARLADTLLRDIAHRFEIPGGTGEDDGDAVTGTVSLPAGEAARRAGVSDSTIRRAASVGDLRARRIGRRVWTITEGDLDEWMSERGARR